MVVLKDKRRAIRRSLAEESNRQAKKFNEKAYSKIENIDRLLLKNDVSVEKKKKILIKKLHGSIIQAFSVDRKRFSRKALESLKKRIHSIRRLIIKLRSANYYLETSFLEELKASKIMQGKENLKPKQADDLAGDELEMLEYTAYKLIGEAAILDKKSLEGYEEKAEKVFKKESLEIKGLGGLLNRQTFVLEHIEAKLPPASAASIALLKEPIFTNWVSRILALISYLEHLHLQEQNVFSKLKKNKQIKVIINKKIKYLIKEKSELLSLMEKKASAMKKFKYSSELRKEMHNLTSAVGL